MNDTISRHAAIRWIKAECNPYGKPTLDYETSCKIMEHLDRMPSAEQKTGRWVKDNYGNTVCSKCLGIRRDNRINYINFCNQCGADMRGEQE